jgi:endonuclease/exonuclease/phosphatase family metal-dependent hydrolase
MTQPKLRVVTYNIHKGFSQFNRRLVLHDIREGLKGVGADVAFLQEVVGEDRGHARRHGVGWPVSGQHAFLCETDNHHAYGMNAVHQHGHYGNAIVSRFPIKSWENLDISHHRFENRGLLHTEITVPGWTQSLHCINVHLGLWARSRRFQLEWLADRIREAVPDDEPVIVAGDFNDWQRKASNVLGHELGLFEVFERSEGRHARSFPARMPMLHLDRIYVRGFGIENVQRLTGSPWAKLSDHVALAATLNKP